MKFLVYLSVIFTSVYGANFLDTNVKELKWDDLEVVWVKDDSFPTYDLVIYFADGAQSESDKNRGASHFMFNQLTSGSSKYSQEEILESLEFYGTSFSSSVTHELSTYSLSGLAKDIVPNTEMICHLFQKATFPEDELKKSKSRSINSIKNLVTDHQALASRVFRELSLSGTPYSLPVEGKVETIKKIDPKTLEERLGHFNKAKKKIYIRGPKEVLEIKDIITEKCGWDGKNAVSSQVASAEGKRPSPKTIYFLPVSQANQAQIRMGRMLYAEESTKDQVKLAFAYKYLGGGFTSRLMQELRVKRGLTYSAGAYASGQKLYGRSGISTFTKNKSLLETLKVIDETVEQSSKQIPETDFTHSLNFVRGNYLLSLESTVSFMSTLMILDHQGRDYKEIYEFSKEIAKVDPAALSTKIKKIFKADEQIKLVLGDKSLVKDLKKAGYKVEVLEVENYL